MENTEIDDISETLRAAADAVGVALRESAENMRLKTFDDLENDDAFDG